MSIVTTIATQVTALLNAAPLVLPNPVTRGWAPAVKRDDLGTTKVTVVPGETTASRLSRNAEQWDVEILVAVQRALTVETDADGLVGLLEQIAVALRDTAIAAATRLTAPVLDPAMDPTHFREQNIYTGVVRVTYRAMQTEAA